MKKILFLLLVLATFSAKAQSVNGTIALKDSTITRTIPFEVASGSKTLRYTVKVNLDAGEAALAFTDPNGKKAGGFTVSSKKKGGGNERSKVESTDSSSPPITGTWKLSIKTENATGKINYEFDVIKP